MMSIISLLNEPNINSPANVDASVMYRRYVDSKGVDKEYENIIKFVFLLIRSSLKKWVFCCFNRKQVTGTLADAEKDGVQVPTTLEEYCVKTVPKDDQNEDCILDELDDIDPYEADDINSNYNNSNTDSGNEES